MLLYILYIGPLRRNHFLAKEYDLDNIMNLYTCIMFILSICGIRRECCASYFIIFLFLLPIPIIYNYSYSYSYKVTSKNYNSDSMSHNFRNTRIILIIMSISTKNSSFLSKKWPITKNVKETMSPDY